MQVNDVGSPKRQQKLAELATVLAKFGPTKIAIEADPDNQKSPAVHRDYVAGKHELRQNETEQISFRLAKPRGHFQYYPIDVEGYFPF